MKELFARLEADDSTFDRAVLLLIFGLALALRLFYIRVAHSDPTQTGEDPRYYSLIARNLISGHGFIEVAARAYRPPAFPWFLAAVYGVFGVKVAFAQFVLAIVGALHPVLTALWGRIFASRRAGYFVGLLAALHPQFIRYPQTLYTEAFYLFVIALATLLLLRATTARSLGGFVLAGVAFGWAALTREVTLLAPLVVGWWFILARNTLNQVSRVGTPARSVLVRNWLVFTLAMAGTVLPWTARNYAIFHTLVPISTNSGINFYIGNNPKAADPTWRVAPGVQWREGAGELQAHRVGLRAGVDYIKAHPASTVAGWFRKAVELWMPPVNDFSGLSRPLQAMRAAWVVFYFVALGFGIYGFMGLGANWRAASLPLLLAFSFSIPYVLTFVTSRFRLPMESWLLFYAGLGIERFLARRLENRDVTPLKPAWQGSSRRIIDLDVSSA